ncbi:type I polyketide synthase, partial [Zavarzinella formosa]|uniref:type I polyketide synthase n=1 Tax=Zavarzinella formosa TaxID=360055 RepID=UPI0019309EF4
MAVENVPLAIVGIGCLFPRADGHRAFWANIKHGEDAVGPVPATHWKPEEYFDADPKSPDMTYAVRGAFLDAYDFNPLEFGISPIDLEATDTSQLLGLVAARQALNDAGYGPDKKYDKNRVSVILGVTGTLELVIPLGARLGHPKWRKALAEAGVDQATADRVVEDISDSYVPWQENSFPGLLGNVVAGRIANKLDLGGTNCVVDAACASSLAAVHLAGLELAAGKCDVAVTGGADTFNDIFMYMCFSKTPALSKTGDAKPFDADGDGTILGEGLGIVVLKRLEDAERDKDRIYAVIRAIGSSSDGKGNAVYAPSAEGQARCLRAAYRQAEISPATVELVEAHGTGTKVGDTVEATALAEVFNQTRRSGTWCAVGSVKSMIGHTKAAAGAAGLIKAALALHHKVLPPTLKVKQPVDPLQPGKSPLYVNLDKRPWLPRAEHPRRAGLSAFGFGGSNFHAILEEHSPKKKTPDWDGRTQLLCFSGNTPTELESPLKAIPADKTWGDICRSAADSRSKFQSTHSHRLILVIRQGEDVGKRLASALAKLKSESSKEWSLPEGTWHGVGPAAGKLGVLFPGQGSQYAGMMREAACAFPEMLDALALADKGREFADRLAEAIYPYSAFTPDQRTEQETRLRSTDIAQPAIGAVSVGAWEILKSFGIDAEAFAGHSYGELVALWAAGVYDTETLHRISRERGRLMADFSGKESGGMLAVHAPLADIEEMLRDAKLNLVFANRNSPIQGVLSGPTADIAKAEVACQKRNMRCTRLPVAAAFHSSLVASASQPLRQSLENMRVSPPQAPVLGNRDGQPYAANDSAIRDQLGAQLAEPVDFVRQIQEMHRLGVRTFLEVGPGQVLTKLSAAILDQESNVECLAVDASGGRKPGLWDLATTLAKLAVRGHAVNLAGWEAGQTYPVSTAKPGLTVPICGANYVRPKPSKPKPTVAPPKPKAVSPVSVPTTLTGPKPPMSQAEPNRTHDPAAVQSAFGITQQSLIAFQRMQEETARLHKQFLDNQQAALATLQALVGQQQALMGGQPLPMPVYVAPVAPVAPPVPAYVPPPAPVYVPPAPPVYTPAPQQVMAPTPPPPRTAVPPKPAPVAKTGPDAGQVLLAVVAEKTGYPADMLG